VHCASSSFTVLLGFTVQEQIETRNVKLSEMPIVVADSTAFQYQLDFRCLSLVPVFDPCPFMRFSTIIIVSIELPTTHYIKTCSAAIE
jgi:hypothetical protein